MGGIDAFVLASRACCRKFYDCLLSKGSFEGMKMPCPRGGGCTMALLQSGIMASLAAGLL